MAQFLEDSPLTISSYTVSVTLAQSIRLVKSTLGIILEHNLDKTGFSRKIMF